MMTNQAGCKDFLQQNRQRFGITENNLKNEYLDICAQHVRCIAARKINEEIVLPSMSSFINSCTGLVDTAGGIDTGFASLRVTHAHEELVDCDCECPGVKVTIRGQIIVRTRPTGCNCAVSYLAIPVELVSETIREFYSTATGDRIKHLKNELPYIDGSCMVINLSCRVCREVCNGCSRYVAQVRGSVVDKLWKSENIWIEGIRPYVAPSVTVCDRFDKDFCGCDDVFGTYARFTADKDRGCNTSDCGCADYSSGCDGCGNCGTNGYCACGTDCGCNANGTNSCADCGSGYGGCGYTDCDNGYGCGYGSCGANCGYNNGGCGTAYPTGCGCDNDCGTAYTRDCDCGCDTDC